MTRLFLLFATCLLVSSCDTQSSSSQYSTTTAPSTKVVENAIVYLFFEIEKDSNGLEKVTLTNTKTTEGFLKNGSIVNKPSTAGNLVISLLGKNGAVVEERIIEDPLNPLLEVYAEEGLSKNKLQLTKGQFSVRFNQKGEISSVKIEKITPNSKNSLITFTL